MKAYEIEDWLYGRKIARKVWRETPNKKALYYIFTDAQWKYGVENKLEGILGRDLLFELFEYNDWEER